MHATPCGARTPTKMDPTGSDEPPSKKRRFFAEEAHGRASSPQRDPRTPPTTATTSDVPDTNHGGPLKGSATGSSGRPSLAPSTLPQRHAGTSSGQGASGPTAPAHADRRPPAAFDIETFESFVGESVDPGTMAIIQEHCGPNMERAINMYLDGTWKALKRQAAPALYARLPPSTTATPGQGTSGRPLEQPPPTFQMPGSRYVGSFGVEGWTTRSGVNLLSHGDAVKIERQRIQTPKQASNKGQTKLGTPLSANRVSAAAAKRVDVIVRFTDHAGREIGRLAKDTANWVSTLMDQEICSFEGTCVYAPERMRTNDTVFLQLRCSLLKSAFFSRGFQNADNRATGRFEDAESSEERALRLRQVALVRLFQEINLLPTRGNAAAATQQRQGLLHAAEMAESKEKDTAKRLAQDSAAPSSPSDDNDDGHELEQDQLDTLYKKAQSFDFNTPEAEPADTFALTLRPYQKQSLHWMMAKEMNVRNEGRDVSMHPLWEEYLWPEKDHDDKALPAVSGQPAFYVNPYSGELSLLFPRQEQHCLGGILADEMGLGKTIQMLSLIHTHRPHTKTETHQHSRPLSSVNQLLRLPAAAPGPGAVMDAPCTTLVVAPMSLLTQWQSEAEKTSRSGALKSMIYYGNEKNTDLVALCCGAGAANAPAVIITSYGVVLSEFSQVASKNGDRSSNHGIFSLNFFRVILDEAHGIKNRQSKTARACYEISARHRWVLTGTPIVNKLEDLFSLVRFLRVEPWSNFSFWRTFITVPFESKEYMRALDVVQTVLEPLVMRRTKDMKTPDGHHLVPLPPKQIEIVDIELSQAERDVYDYIFTRAKRTFLDNVQAGTVMKAFTSIFAQILRLRQSCCHPVLVRNQEIVAEEVEAGAAADAAAGLADDMDLQSLIERFTATTDDANDSNAFGAHVLGQIRDEAINECPICAEEPMVDQTVTGCWHSACKKCLLDYIKHQTDRHQVPRCFHCREPINSRDLFEVVRHDDDLGDVSNIGEGPSRITLQRLGASSSSAKVVALINHLRELRKGSPSTKSVVFSQFTSFLSLIEPALTRVKMRFLRLDGSMAQKSRAAVLDEFRDSDKFTVLLISLKAGGVGLNLTSAKRVYMMDPWWSFAIEAQAIDRIHRMGQEDEVKVYRFIVKDSVEQRMLKIQDRKKFM